MSIINNLKNLPKCDPIVYAFHNFLYGHRQLVQDFSTHKNELSKEKFEDSTAYQRSIFTRSVMQCSALIFAGISYYSGLLHSIFHALPNITFCICFTLCLLAGHLIGMAIGMLLGSCIANQIYPDKELSEI